MKIALINAADTFGGAARALYRLHKNLLASGIQSRMFVLRKESDDYTVIGPKYSNITTRIRDYLDCFPKNKYRKRTSSPFSVNWLPCSPIPELVKKFNPDLIYLHWIGGGAISIADISKFNKPIIWSLPDNWAFTGGCHIMHDCEKYKDKCGACPKLGSRNNNDLSRKIFNRKRKMLKKTPHITFFGKSRWIVECISKSKLLSGYPVELVPNLIDTDLFKPFEKNKAREILGIRQDKKVVLFGAMQSVSDENKGYHQLREALFRIKEREFNLLIFGSSKPETDPFESFNTEYIGQLYDAVSLKILYCSADVMIVPSLQENLSNVIMESLSCGTPVVAFNVGGNPDLIDHKKTGYLAEPYDTSDLAKGIEWVIDTPEYMNLCLNARKKIIETFDPEIIIQRHIEIYKRVVSA